MDLKKRVLKLGGLKKFNPMQELVLKRDWQNKSLVVSSPTASGKTLVAELLALNSIVSKKKKVVYTCPLKALAFEHYSEFKKKYSASLKVRFGLSTGDLDSSSRHLQNYDLIFTTYEKLDSLIRHKVDWLQDVGLLIIDEVHEIDSGRGATLEVTACKLMQLNSKMQVLALSATIPNSSELSEWLGAELVESDYRPIPLREGVYFDKELLFADGGKAEAVEGENPLEAVVSDTISVKKKQAMVFANTRRNAEGMAKRLCAISEKSLGKREKTSLKRDAEKILSALESPTEQCRKLASLIEKGAAFHHAGLMMKQRGIVEEAFKENRLKVISATPTLAAGVNLPSHTVVLPSLYRFEAFGMTRIPVREYKQMVGRAGRPKYDSEGRGISIAKGEIDADDIMEHYLKGEIEEITSKLGIGSVLRMHLLSLVATSFVFDLHSMEEFFKKTFYAKQYGDLAELFSKVQEALRQLEEWEFIESDEKRILATPLGKRVSELYLDPMTAHTLVEAMSSKKEFSDFSWLFLFAQSSEFRPWLSVPKKKEPELWEQLQINSSQLPVDIEKEMYFDLNLLRKFNSAILLEDWVSEKSEQEILKEFNTQPGILHSKLFVCDWLAYSALEIAKLLSFQNHFSALSKMRRRMKYGIKEELVGLCEVKYIGRVRARRLWRAKIKSVEELKRIDKRDLARIIGEAVAAKVKLQIGQ